MPGKNNVSELRKKKEGAILTPDIDEVKKPSLPEKVAKPAPANNSKGVGGRPAKPKTEKRSYKVVLSLTEAEGRVLSEKAGLAGDATYLYAKLKELGEL